MTQRPRCSRHAPPRSSLKTIARGTTSGSSASGSALSGSTKRAATPSPRRGGGDEPEEGRREQAGPQVVEDLPSVDGAEDVGQPLARAPAGDARGEPGQELPVAADPAGLPPREGEGVVRGLLEEHD